MNQIVVLEVQSLSVQAGNISILKDISFNLLAGEKVAVMGLSGSGKSTLLDAIGGLQSWDKSYRQSGRIWFHNTNLLEADPAALNHVRSHQIGFIFQEPMACFNPVKRVGEQIVYALKKNPLAAQVNLKQKILNEFERIGILSPEQAFISFPHQLSGGQLQRIMTIFALIHRPELILADEPVSALDEVNKKVVLDILETEREKNQSAILMVTHDFQFARSWADRIFIMDDGKIAESGTPVELSETSNHPFTRSLFSFEEKRQHLAVEFSKSFEHPQKFTSETVLQVRSLFKSYTDFGISKTILHDINLMLKKGRIVGITGPSGCGKSTLARCILRLEKIDDGSISWFNKDVTNLDFDSLRPFRRQFQIVFQDTNLSLPPHLTIEEILQEAMYVAGKEKENVTGILSSCGLDLSVRKRYPSQLSGGQRQRVCMARTLLFRPGLLILDEAISMLDPVTQFQIMELLLKINQRDGTALIFITHDREWLHTVTHDIIEL